MKENPKQTDKISLLPLDSAAAEVVFAPFHDPMISVTLPVALEPVHAAGCKINFGWCWTTLSWETCPPDSEAASFSIKTVIDVSSYDNLILCMAIPRNVSAFIGAEVDGVWQQAGKEINGTGLRSEILLPLDGKLLTEIKFIFKSYKEGFKLINLSWFGLQKSALLRQMLESRLKYDPEWHGLIKPISEWGEICFERGLLFDESDLINVRTKCALPGWKEHYDFLESKALECLGRRPEDDIADYIPLNDLRYIRQRETGKTPYHFEALLLGFVGLVNKDKKIMMHALRYLMSMLHTRHWTQSAESRLRGSTWDQRCFFEEITTTSVSLLADWYSFALTERAMDLIRQSLFDKGLAIIERDMMKSDYLYYMNQGAVFCRGRILGGLLLEGAWPHMGDYVDRAFSDMTKVLNNYIQKDGGVHEGIGYYCQTMQAVISAGIAYCRKRGKNVKKFLRSYFSESEKFVAVMSGSIPGTGLPYGDCRTEYFGGDVVPVMAGFFPGSVYDKILYPCIKIGSIYAVTGTLSKSGGLLGLVYGPQKVGPEEKVVPTFSILKKTGQLTSYRKFCGLSLRLHIYGAKAKVSHTHLDKGSLIVEMDDVPVFVDRGMIEYWHSDTLLLQKSFMHNVITPVLNDGSYPDQMFPVKAVIPYGKGDERKLKAGINLTHVWENHMRSCTRRVESNSPSEILIFDDGKLKEGGKIAFHLHSPFPFATEPGCKKVKVTAGAINLEITAEWAEEIIHRVESVNLKHEPVNHLMIRSGECTTFSLKTIISRLQNI